MGKKVSLIPYAISHAMKSTPKEGSSFGNHQLMIAISLRVYLENDMKYLNKPPLFFQKAARFYSTCSSVIITDHKTKNKLNRSFLWFFRHFREKRIKVNSLLTLFQACGDGSHKCIAP